MKKKAYDLSKVQNELKGASAFFQTPASPASAPTSPADAPIKTPPSHTNGGTPTESTPDVAERTPVRSVRPVRPVRRQMIRHPFELYQDQVENLRQLAANDRMQGGSGSMSAMVREAIDRLLDDAAMPDNPNNRA